MSEAVRYFTPDSPQLARKLRAKLEKEIGELLGALLDAQDWPDFNKRRGVIQGLYLAIGYCEEIEKQEGN